MQEVGKIYYYSRDYKNAYRYYKKFTEIREFLKLDIYKSEDAKIGFVFSEMGLKDEAKNFFEDYRIYAENDQSIYKHLSLALYYSQLGDKGKAIEHLKLFSDQNNYHYWIVIFTPIDPLVDNIKEMPEFKEVFKKIENQFWDYHKQINASLKDKDLL